MHRHVSHLNLVALVPAFLVSACYLSHRLPGSSADGDPPADPTPTEPPEQLSNPAVALDLGSDYACAVRASGSVYCWGAGEDGQLGIEVETSEPIRVDGLPPMRSVAADYGHACGMTMSDEVYCWGRNSFQARAAPTEETPITPTPLTSIPTGSSVQVGTRHTCVITSQDNLVMCRGTGLEGQLTWNARSGPWAPVPIQFSAPVVAIDSHDKSLCVLLEGGVVSCWGGLLGHEGSSRVYRGLPMGPELPSPAVDIAVGRGGEHFREECAVLASGQVTCWHRTSFADPNAPPIPVVVDNLSGVAEVDLGHELGCARTDEGGVLCWGRNASGQLGDGTFDGGPAPSRLRTPARVVGIDSAIAVSTGDRFACAILQTGQVMCWGDNRKLQLGSPGMENSPVPVEIALPSDRP